MLDFDEHEQEIDISECHVLQIISAKRSRQSRTRARALIPSFDLSYSNSIWRKSSIRSSILIELFLSDGLRKECMQRSFASPCMPCAAISLRG
jgi:hypothetical protein